MIAVVIRSAAQRDQAGLDAAATLKSPSRYRVVFAISAERDALLRRFRTPLDTYCGFLQVAPPPVIIRAVCTATTIVCKNNTVLR
jgi:hypothetical protein